MNNINKLNGKVFLFFSLVAIVMLLGLLLRGVVLAQVNDPAIIVNLAADEEKKNDGKCTLREAVIAANSNKASGGKPGECVPVTNSGGGYTIFIDAAAAGTDTFTLTRTDNGSEDSSTTGDLDVKTNITLRSAVPVVIQGGLNFTDRIFHILPGGKLTAARVTIRDGHAKFFGGGIMVESGGQLNLTNSTLTANNAGTSGGAIYNNGQANLNYVMVKDNTAGPSNSPTGGGLVNSNTGTAAITLNNSYIDNNSCAGTIGGQAAHNLARNAAGCNAALSDPAAVVLTEVAPGYFEIPQSSNAVDAGSAPGTICPATDQPGNIRPQGLACDIGTFETVPADQPPTATDQTINNVLEDQSYSFNLDVTDPNGNIDWSAGGFTLLSGPSHGTLSGPAGSASVTYDPDKHFDEDSSGTYDDSFSYEICDLTAPVPLCDTAVVNIEVTPDAYLEVTNVCDSGDQSLRQRIEQANAQNNSDTIVFDIIHQTGTCGTDTINLLSALPALVVPMTIDGLADDGNFSPPADPYITLDGACQPFNGLTILGTGGSTIANLIIQNMGGSGITIGDVGAPSSGNQITGNIISGNGCSTTPVENETDPTIVYDDAVTIIDGQENLIDNNQFFGNAGQSIDLGGDGTTANDSDDEDLGANYQQNYMWNLSATPGNASTNGGEIDGFLNSVKNSNFTFQFFVTDSCGSNSSSSTPLDTLPLIFSTDSQGNVRFTAVVQPPYSLVEGEFVYGTVTDSNGNTSEYSNCVPVDDNNTVWPLAFTMESGDSISQKLTRLGQSRWYVFENAQPNSKIKFKLTLPDNLPPDFVLNVDLVGFGDIEKAYADLVSSTDLDFLDANFPTDAFSPAEFNAALYNPAEFNPAEFNPAEFNPAEFNPAEFNELAFNSTILNTALYSADVWSSSIFAPAEFNPAEFNPAEFNPAEFNPAVVEGNAYAAAQTVTLITASGNEGQESEEITINTYNNSGKYYARVRGRQGGFDPQVEFTISLTVEGGVCDGLQEDFGLQRLAAANGNYQTVILVDYGRMGLANPANADRQALEAKLGQLAAATSGVVVDVGQDAEVLQRNWQADATGTDYRTCPYAKNVVADGIKDIIDAYRALNPVEYVVVIGDDDDIPFYRYADTALLGPEEDYVPPVDGSSASEASLRNNTILTQDPYVANVGLQMKNTAMPIQEIAIGRLVETVPQIMTMIDAYLAAPVIQPQNAFVSSYDFLIDSGTEVNDLLQGSDNSVNVSSLINDTWTAADLKSAIEDPSPQGDYALMYLGGHFSASAALAADYKTFYTAKEFRDSLKDYQNMIVFSAGCHSGYNIVNDHNVPYTFEPDWPAAAAENATTLIAGTGYQYADTDFNAYSERLYTEFARQLRSDAEAEISIGNALMRAKHDYLVNKVTLRGIDQKSLLIATIFGLPMTKVNMPGERYDLSAAAPTLTEGDLLPNAPDPQWAEPGQVFGLKYFDLFRPYQNMPNQSYTLTEYEKDLTSVYDELDVVTTTYLKNETPNIGPNDGLFLTPGEPVLPRDTFDATVVNSNMVLRGIGFMEGDYQDVAGKIPLVNAPSTELSAVHFDFLSFDYYPQTLWSINRIDTLLNEGGRTLLNFLPAQYRTEPPTAPDDKRTATRRQFNNAGLRLFYLPENFMDNVDTGINRPDLAAAPTIVSVNGSNSANGSGTYDVHFEVQAIVDPSAGMQDVWVTYTRESHPGSGGGQDSWQSLFLEQDPFDTSMWKGTLYGADSGINSEAEALRLRFIAQAVSGTGLVTMSNNLGRFYIPGDSGFPTLLTEVNPAYPKTAAVGTTVSFSARLADENNNPLLNMPILFSVGHDFRLGWTGIDGITSVNLPIIGTPPGTYDVIISFPGTAVYAPSTAETGEVTVTAQDTIVTLDPASAFVSSLQPDVPIVAELRGLVNGTPDTPLAEKTVTFTIRDQANNVVQQKAVITNPDGRARLGLIELPAIGTYSVTAEFAGTSAYNPSGVSNTGTIAFVKVLADGKSVVWPTNNKMLNLSIVLSNGAPISGFTAYYSVIEQDEPVGGGADAAIQNLGQKACVRAERDGNGNGRVYRIQFTLVDNSDSSNTIPGVAFLATIPHDQGDGGAGINDAPPYYNSLGDGSAVCPN